MSWFWLSDRSLVAVLGKLLVLVLHIYFHVHGTVLKATPQHLS